MKSRPSHYELLPMKGDRIIRAGAMVASRADGYYQAAITAPYGKAAGVAAVSRDSDGHQDGSLMILVYKGIFLMRNHPDDPVKPFQKGGPCYIVNDSTVAGTCNQGSRGLAGEVHSVTIEGVWVIF